MRCKFSSHNDIMEVMPTLLGIKIKIFLSEEVTNLAAYWCEKRA
jgi:hypothetical protein